MLKRPSRIQVGRICPMGFSGLDSYYISAEGCDPSLREIGSTFEEKDRRVPCGWGSMAACLEVSAAGDPRIKWSLFVKQWFT